MNVNHDQYAPGTPPRLRLTRFNQIREQRESGLTAGPYACVRNPIYTGMFGMLIATGLAMEHWLALAAAIVIFAVGLVIRVRTEEKLLRAAFGEEFEEYAKRVPAVLPGIY
jgi:protein-S-isoprenylcysteine O-methyltransferase Ste14